LDTRLLRLGYSCPFESVDQRLGEVSDEHFKIWNDSGCCSSVYLVFFIMDWAQPNEYIAFDSFWIARVFLVGYRTNIGGKKPEALAAIQDCV